MIWTFYNELNYHFSTLFLESTSLKSNYKVLYKNLIHLLLCAYWNIKYFQPSKMIKYCSNKAWEPA